MKYRPDIDGLRAISVLLVIMFHANVGIFTGGFIGVDVFFVISGYLITRIIYDAATASSFSFVEFYNRRIRRILPALFVVLFASAILGYYLLAPREYLSFGKSLIYSSIALSNFLFMSQVGYFDAPAHTKPLLHTWSLGIEEQFYLFFPLIIYLAVKYIPRKINMLIVTLFIISLAANILLVVSHQSVAFYSPITRAWEFLMGSMLAVNLRNFKIKRATLKECASLIGIASIIIPAIIYDKNTLFPGWNAILPCLGAALLIFSNADGKTAVGKVLSVKSVVFIGLISYSLYLWHWPILIYSKYIFMHDPNITELSITLLIIFVLSCLTWKFVERPFRKNALFTKRKPLYAVCSSSLAFLLLLGASITSTDGFASRFYSTTYNKENVIAYNNLKRYYYKNLSLEKFPAENVGFLGDKNKPPLFLVLGDSHAEMYNPLINQLALETGTAGVVASHGECPPVLANDVGRHHQLCPAFNNLAIKLIVREYKIKVAILCASWLAYYREVPEDGSHHSPDGFWYKSGNDLYPDMLPMINALKDAGVDQIWIVAPTPTYQIAITEYLLLNDKRGGTREKAQQTYAYHLGRAKQLLNSMERLEQKGHASIAHPYRQFCQDDGNCYAYSDKDIFYSDSNHLTFSGAMNAREAFLPIFAEIKYLQMKSAVASAK